MPIVLCYLHGLTHDLAARELHCPVGTVRSRLARGRSLLHRRITRRGLALSAAGSGALLKSSAGAAGSARLPASLVESITRAASKRFYTMEWDYPLHSRRFSEES